MATMRERLTVVHVNDWLPGDYRAAPTHVVSGSRFITRSMLCPISLAAVLSHVLVEGTHAAFLFAEGEFDLLVDFHHLTVGTVCDEGVLLVHKTGQLR